MSICQSVFLNKLSLLQLSCHVENVITITLLHLGWKQKLPSKIEAFSLTSHWTALSLGHVIVYGLFGTQSLPELMLNYHCFTLRELILSKLLSTCKLIFQASQFLGEKLSALEITWLVKFGMKLLINSQIWAVYLTQFNIPAIIGLLYVDQWNACHFTVSPCVILTNVHNTF